MGDGYVPPQKIKIVPKPVNGKQFSSYNEEVRGAAGGEGGRQRRGRTTDRPRTLVSCDKGITNNKKRIQKMSRNLLVSFYLKKYFKSNKAIKGRGEHR